MTERHDRHRRRADRTTRPVAAAVEPTFFSRFECKYLVTPLVVPEIRRFLSPFMRLDGFAARRGVERYPICSLYLDSHDLRLYQQTRAGEKDRFKLRVRTYDDDPDSPAYFEVKRKLNTIVHKRRFGLARSRAARLLAAGRPDWDPGLGDEADLDYFLQHAALIEARPVVRVRYLREAYEGAGGEPVRITVDTELAHAMTFTDDIRHGTGTWVRTPLDGAIVEIKYTERFPWWVHDFVRAFGLRQQAVPKYILSLDHVLDRERAAALSLAGLTLPAVGPR